MTHTTPRRLLRLPDVRRICGLQTTAIYELEAAGRFPRRVRLTGRSVAWPEDEIAQWTAERIAERDAQQPAA